MAEPTDVRLTPPIDGILKDILSGIRDIKSGRETASLGTEAFSKMVEELKDNTEALRKNTDALIRAAGRGGGAGTPGGGSSGQLNAQTPGEGETGASAASSSSRLPEWRQALEKGEFLRAGERLVGDILTPKQREGESQESYDARVRRVQNTSIGVSAAFGALPAGRTFYNRTMAQMQNSVNQRVGEPTQIGMLQGAMGPGSESVTSSFGSYLSSFFAAPSLLLSGGQDPGMFGFGGNMSEATSAGWRSRYRAFTRGALNPFDMLSYQQALEINASVASKGFRSEGEQVSVEEAVTDIVQSMAIDAGSALDVIDLAIKRLNMDSQEATGYLKEYGELSKAAGKGVVEFTKEVTAALNMVTAGGAKGPGAFAAAESYAGVPQVEASRVMEIFGGQEFMGLQAANLMQSGGSPEQIMALAAGAPMGAGGELGVLESQFNAVKDIVDRMKAGPARGNERLAYVLAGNIIGARPLEVKNLYKHGEKILSRARASTAARGLKQDFDTRIFGKEGRQARASSNAGQAALKNLVGQYKPGEGEGFDIDELMISGGADNPQLQSQVADLYDAMHTQQMGGGSDLLEATYRKYGGREKLAQAEEIVQRLLTIGGGRGNLQSSDVQSAWRELSSMKGVTVGVKDRRGGMPAWQTTQRTLTGAQSKELQNRQRDIVQNLFREGGILEAQKEDMMEKLRTSHIPAKEFSKQISDLSARKRQQENAIEIKLSEDAAKYFDLVNPDPGSVQGKSTWKYGMDMRAGMSGP